MARRRRLTPAVSPAPGSAPPISTPVSNAPAAAAPIAKIAGQSAEAAALREITAGIQAARDEGRMVIEIPLAEIAPDHLLRDRLAIGAEDLAALKASIAAHGQRVPAEVTPLEGGGGGSHYGLISGWRRLQALTALAAETGEARFGVLRALVRPAGAAAESYTAMVEENELRVGLSYYERARLVAELTARGVFADQSEALRTLFGSASRAKRSKIGSFIDIHEALGDLLRYPAEIPERLGLALVSRLRLGGRSEIRSALTKAGNAASAAEELALLERLARKGGVSRAKQADKPDAETLRDGLRLWAARRGRTITLTLSGDRVDDALLARLQEAIRKAEG